MTRKKKITVSIDADLLRMVDTFIQDIKINGISRSSVIEEGLRLWRQVSRDNFDEQYYAEYGLEVDDE